MKIFLSICLFLAILSEVTAEKCKVKKLNDSVSQGTCETSKGGSCFFRVIGRRFRREEAVAFLHSASGSYCPPPYVLVDVCSNGTKSREIPSPPGKQRGTERIASFLLIPLRGPVLLRPGKHFRDSQAAGKHADGSTKLETEGGCTTDCTSGNYIFTSGKDNFLRDVRFCCHAIDCYKKFFQLQQPELNGQECPTCFPSFSKACKGSETIKCYDDQTQCIEFVVDHDDSAIPEEDFYGCASPNFCAMAKKSMHFYAFSGTITKARCSDTLPLLEQLNFEG
ncbi:uncharacterized protein LOC128419123 [Podarcis raffonei]|uniref:uncharacterized protein LOC128419123 n=1 Tax=Podarcis raffonei TaxID=65483 RepID=UPI0023293E8B|nr:uncharacterized protein LOC128419123 [Podarcis raffonei]